MGLWIKNLSVRCKDMLCKLDEHGVIVRRIVAGHPSNLDNYIDAKTTQNTYFVADM